MRLIATEFPIKPVANRATFVAEVIAWLRGSSYSNVLGSEAERELDGDNVVLRSQTGEELRIRELSVKGEWRAIGFRHDLPDERGRLWRTEGVLKRPVEKSGEDLIRFRTQCLARMQGAILEDPRKLYLIKNILRSNAGGTDVLLPISDQPLFLPDSSEGLEIARSIAEGAATRCLPVVYLSAVNTGIWLLKPDEINKLAYDLGGIAHVVVEPSSDFSVHLRNLTSSVCTYNGSIGLLVPDRGIVGRYYLGWKFQNRRELSDAIRNAATAFRSQMPATGWDWTELQEAALHEQRRRDKNRLSSSETEQLYIDEIKNLKDRLEDLDQQISIRSKDREVFDTGDLSIDNIVRLVGPEIYSGEIADRLRYACQVVLANADQIGLDERSMAIFSRVVVRIQPSTGLSELLQSLERATKDPKRIAVELERVLCCHGYQRKSINKHVRLEAEPEFEGLDSVTLASTPSEIRGLQNLRSQIERKMGLSKLQK